MLSITDLIFIAILIISLSLALAGGILAIVVADEVVFGTIWIVIIMTFLLCICCCLILGYCDGITESRKSFIIRRNQEYEEIQANISLL